MVKKSSAEVITELQQNQDYIILNNIFATPTFRKIAKEGEEGKNHIVNEIYAPKIFFEILSQLTPQHLIDSDGEYVTINFKIGDFLESIGSMNSNNDYNYIIDYVKKMQEISVNFEDAKFKMGFSVITYYKYERSSGMMRIDIRIELAQAILAVKESENFSFLKKYILKLNSAQAIKFFPFLVSWRNKGMVEMNLEIFRKKFGYNTNGYKSFINIKIKVLDPVIKEINEKTDLLISYKPLGKNLEGARQRVTGLQFFIKEKAKQKQLPQQAVAENTTYEEVETTPIQLKPTTVKAPKYSVSQGENPYLADILRVFQIFEPESTSDNVQYFLSAFENPKAVLEACLYAEQEQSKGRPINNFRGYIVSGVMKGLGFGILEQRTQDQAKAQQAEQKKQTEADKATELENLLKEAAILRGGYRTEMDALIKKTTAKDKEKAAVILRQKSYIFSGKTVEDFENKRFIVDYLDTLIATYPERFAVVQNTYQKAFDALTVKIKKLDPMKAKNLFHY